MKKIITILLCLFLCILVYEYPSFAKEKDSTLSIQFANDFFGGGTDRHFTHGSRFEYLTEPIPWITRLADKLPWFDSSRDVNPLDTLEGRGTLSIGQNIYTPENTYTVDLVHGERPYAGWMYLGFGMLANQGRENFDRYDKILLELGVIGPQAFAEDIQTFWHSLLGLHVPEGWDNQIENEPGVVIYYEQGYRLFPKKKIFGLEYDIVPHVGGALGNVFTYVGAGYVVRLGQKLKKDFGPPKIRPGLPGGGYLSENGFNWNIFIGLEGRLVFQNVFLD